MSGAGTPEYSRHTREIRPHVLLLTGAAGCRRQCPASIGNAGWRQQRHFPAEGLASNRVKVVEVDNAVGRYLVFDRQFQFGCKPTTCPGQRGAGADPIGLGLFIETSSLLTWREPN